ncbi:Cmx/CmrA family chloramphenicol efflux MFS transporter [Nocardia cyriacigeorgica]|uniref:Cmx/CmrA family chloramphenicol efflux MFS transporter n=1 Tax=Nocardia cyriacigeorgica TaxID=135487 RepID=UPI002805AEA5|nr:Cmx/CmrA family chloramphenicol efflux MFS transporter [Nocardia cyriacigeorgica]
MPIAIYILGLSIFAQGTSELMLAGLLTEMSADLGVSVPRAGLLISAFALGMLAGAPVLAVLTLRWSRRTALLVFLAVFIAAHIVGALATDYWVVFGTRVVAAFVYAGFWAVAAATAIGLVPENMRGRAMSVVAGGLTVATVVGLPLGTVIGQHFGWRAAFWAVAILSAPAMIGVLAKIPGGRPARTPRVRSELAGMVRPRLWLSYAMTAVATGALLVTFSYLGAMLTETTGLAGSLVPVVLAGYGVGALAGIVVGGRVADRHPMRTLTVGVTGLIVSSALIALTRHARRADGGARVSVGRVRIRHQPGAELPGVRTRPRGADDGCGGEHLGVQCRDHRGTVAGWAGAHRRIRVSVDGLDRRGTGCGGVGTGWLRGRDAAARRHRPDRRARLGGARNRR